MIRAVYYLFLFALLCGCQKDTFQRPPEEEYDRLVVMTYNVLFNTSDDLTLEVLRAVAPDIVGLQEVSATRLAMLGSKMNYYYHSFPRTSANLGDNDTGILSRFPIVRSLPNGLLLQVNATLQVAVFTVHLKPYPYEPYDFRDGVVTTAEEAVHSASVNRLPGLEPVLKDIEDARANQYTVFLTGDFNEPSLLDWTVSTAEKQMHFGKVVPWPVSDTILKAGLKDAYRVQFPDAANFPGYTWTTFQTDNEVYDRIDMIYHTPSDEMTLSDIRTVGGPDDFAGITVPGYPSDHYAVVATYALKK